MGGGGGRVPSLAAKAGEADLGGSGNGHSCPLPRPLRGSLPPAFGPSMPRISLRSTTTQDLPWAAIISAFSLHTAVLFSLQSLCLVHTGKPTSLAVFHCITQFQTQLILTTCQIRYHAIVGSS